MALLSDIYIKVETLQTLLDTVKKKGEKGLSITVSVNDETNDYGQNVTSFVSQTKEQREQKVNKFYVGNGKVFWTNGTCSVATKKEAHTAKQEYAKQVADIVDQDDLPF